MTHVNQKTYGIQRGEIRGCAVVAQTVGVLGGEDVVSRDGTQTFKGRMRWNVVRRSKEACLREVQNVATKRELHSFFLVGTKPQTVPTQTHAVPDKKKEYAFMGAQLH